MLTVTYFFREPRKTGVSIEGIFGLVKRCLKDRVDIREYYCDARVSRFRNILRASKSASAINHITGDVNFLLLGLRGRKNILTIHDMGHYETLRKRGYLPFLVYRLFWFKYPLKCVDIVTVVSEFTRSKLLQFFDFPPGRIRVIPDPVKPVFQFVPLQQRNPIPRVLMMGTGKHKNLDTLIEALKGTGYQLDIIGWPAGDELLRLKEYGIAYTVYNNLSDEEVFQRYQACDVLFNASYYEGFGMPIIEAQSVGRPVITSNFGSMKEIAGDSAVLVEPRNAGQITDAIHKLVTDKTYYDEMVARGRENIVHYGYQAIAQQYLDVYRELSN